MNIFSITLVFMLSLSATTNCLTSSEAYASEVVVPSYDLIRAQIIGEQVGDYVRLPSQYDSNLIVLLQETSNPKGMSVRIQKPTEVKEIREPRIKIISTLNEIDLKQNMETSWYGWAINCDNLICSFEKNSITLTVQRDQRNQQVSIEMAKELPVCDSVCSGYCLSLTNYSVCLDARTKQDLDVILRYSNISRSVNPTTQLFSSYRIAGTEGVSITDIVSTYNKTIDWKQAMLEDLTYLNSQNIIHLSQLDIESIAIKSREGQAGINYRIVFEKNSSEWKPYYQTINSSLSSERDCNTYPATSATPTVQPSGWNAFYIVPLILSISGIILIMILVLVARVITSPKRKKR